MEGSLTPEGGGPYDGDMESRVARLESGVSDIKATLVRLEPVLNRMSKDLVELKVSVAKLGGRVSQLPSTIQMIGFVRAVLAIAGVTRFFGGG